MRGVRAHRPPRRRATHPVSAGHPSHSYTSEHARQYDALLHLPWFQLAMDRACTVTYEDDLPYVGGSMVGPPSGPGDIAPRSGLQGTFPRQGTFLVDPR